MTLHLQTVEARKGLLWIRHALKVYRRRPLALTALYAVVPLIGLLLSLLPPPFEWVVLALPPLVSLGFMLATHGVLQGHVPTAAVYLAPFRLTAERRKTQLLLCLIYALFMAAGLLLSQWADGGALDHLAALMQQDPKDEQALMAAVADPAWALGPATLMLWVSVLSIPFWHAPALVHWAGQGLAQSLFSSTLALWRNRGAFFMSMLGWLGLSFCLGITAMLLGSPFGIQTAQVLLVLVYTWLTTAFYASLYFSFVDCFMFSPEDIKV
ncbi:MAG TPA: BPSS1780 family membrane protein [Burkholderiaceae bacterium]|jgi:hypothetical protein